MINACFHPDTDHLVEQILQHASPGLRTEPDFKGKLQQCLDILKGELGYEISIEVEVHGSIEAAFKSLEGDTSDYVLHQRPVRRIKT